MTALFSAMKRFRITRKRIIDSFTPRLYFLCGRIAVIEVVDERGVYFVPKVRRRRRGGVHRSSILHHSLHTREMDLTTLYFIKFARIMVIWVALYVIDKVWQDKYVQSLVKNEERGDESEKPPSLWPIIIIALGAEAVFMMVVLLCLVLAGTLYGGPSSAYFLDASLFRMIGIDYALSTAVLIGVGLAVSSVAQNGRMFRFRDDGMRGIRATCSLLLTIAAIVISLPWFVLVTYPNL